MKFLFSIFLLLLIVSITNSCSKDPALSTTNNLNGNVISAFGHAGMGLGFKFPIDTYESIEPCIRIGADGSEMDIQMSKDSVLIAYHHSELEESTLCSGMINDQLWSDIWGCHHASPYSSKINLISFSDLMTRLTAAGYDIHDYIFTFDCKLYSHTVDRPAFLNQFANAILNVIDKFELQDKLLIESQDTTFLRVLQQKRNGLKLFIYPSNFKSGLLIAKSMGLFGITIHTDEITTEQVQSAHNNGLQITLWGINSARANIEAIQKAPDYVQTDKIIDLLKLFGKYKHNINEG